MTGLGEDSKYQQSRTAIPGPCFVGRAFSLVLLLPGLVGLVGSVLVLFLRLLILVVLLAEDEVVALGKVLGLGQADTNDAHRWNLLVGPGGNGVRPRAGTAVVGVG